MKIKNKENLPSLYVITNAEMQKNAVGFYSATKNILSIDELLGKAVDGVTAIQKDGSCPENILSTIVHELYHWVDAQEYEKHFGKITADNYSKYIKHLNDSRKVAIKKLGITKDNVHNISEYAKDSFFAKDFDEVYTEYRTKKLLKR